MTQRTTTRGPKGRPAAAGDERRRRRFEERDRRIRDTATRLFLDKGMDGFTVADIASAIDYSKGIFYHHYTSKEDALLEVLLRHAGILAGLYEKAGAAPFGTRARISAMLELNIRGSEEHAELLPLSIAFFGKENLARAGTERRAALDAMYARENAVSSGLVREALSRGDLTLPEGRHATWPLFVLSSVSFGSMCLASSGTAGRKYTLTQMRPVLAYAFDVALDGLGWKPVGGGESYRDEVATLHRVVFGPVREVRAEEV
jgi:AcrR family transcriptional regulator